MSILEQKLRERGVVIPEQTSFTWLLSKILRRKNTSPDEKRMCQVLLESKDLPERLDKNKEELNSLWEEYIRLTKEFSSINLKMNNILALELTSVEIDKVKNLNLLASEKAKRASQSRINKTDLDEEKIKKAMTEESDLDI